MIAANSPASPLGEIAYCGAVILLGLCPSLRMASEGLSTISEKKSPNFRPPNGMLAARPCLVMWRLENNLCRSFVSGKKASSKRIVADRSRGNPPDSRLEASTVSSGSGRARRRRTAVWLD